VYLDCVSRKPGVLRAIFRSSASKFFNNYVNKSGFENFKLIFTYFLLLFLFLMSVTFIFGANERKQNFVPYNYAY